PRGQDRTPEEPASSRIARVAVLDRRSPWRMELLLQATRSQDHAKWLEQARRNGRRFLYCYGSTRCVNPVAPQGGGELGFIMHLARDKVKVLTTMMCESDSGEDREPIDQRDGSVG